MTYIIIASLLAGVASGYFFLPEGVASNLDSVSSFALNLLLLSVGIDLGYNKEVFYGLRKIGFKVILVPLSVITGSLIGGIVSGIIFGMPINISLAISSGLGYYSLSGVLLSKLSGPEAGTIAFLSNVMREFFSILIIPFIAQKLDYIASIAPAGATSMDTTLPIISESTDNETAVIAFINGAILSALVPILVPLLHNL